MMRYRCLILLLVGAQSTPGPQIDIKTSKGALRVELTPDHAPATVANFLAYVDASFFDGLTFHRVIKGFMAQGGGFDSSLKEKPALFPPIKLEASTSLSNTRGTLAMARTSDPNSATSEFFINHADNSFLDAAKGKDGYAVFGFVIDGMSVLDAIATVKTHSVTVHGQKFDDVPKTPVVIESIRRVVVEEPTAEPAPAPTPRPSPRSTVAPMPEPTPAPTPRHLPASAPDPTSRPTPQPTVAPTPALRNVMGGTAATDDALMAQRAHGTCTAPVQAQLRWGCDRELADDICCYNRNFAEPSGYDFETPWPDAVTEDAMDYYDSVSGRPLFRAPVGRSRETFLAESKAHGWPSFRDNEVYWDNVRVLSNGETVSIDGTHLGHNLPDDAGNRYCINLVSIAGQSCDAWFGAGAASDDVLTTIVDLDVSEAFCAQYNLTAPCTYIHWSGPGSGCHLPGPPDACHRYVRVTYASCPVYVRGGVDADDRFDAATGVLRACADDVVRIETSYWGPPAADPRRCGPKPQTAAAAQNLPVTYVLALLGASAALVVVFAAYGRRGAQGPKYAPTEVEIPRLDPDESFEDVALV